VTAVDVTEAPWKAVADGVLVSVMVDDDDLQLTVCVIPPVERGRWRSVVERVEVAERIVADHRAARQRAYRPAPDAEVVW